VKARRALAGLTIAASAFATLAGTSGQAGASVAVSGSRGAYWQDNATCGAFTAYERKNTPGRFGVMVRDSRSALHYLRVDVAWWAMDRRHHASQAELATDRAFVGLDCADYAAQEDS